MKKKFEQPQILVIAFNADDVITASGDNLGGWKDTWNTIRDVSVN